MIRVPFDLALAVEDVVEILGGRAAEKGLDLMMRYSPYFMPRVIGDPGRIRQILMNLIGNAIKFTDNGHVFISVECSDVQSALPYFTFYIEDTGIGIAQEKLPALFDKFTQADTSTTRNYGGTGLGLAISKQLVELMGGQMAAFSLLGKGSKFSFTLPLPLEATEPVQNGWTASLKGAKVLLVDDNVLNVRILAEQLTAVCQAELVSVSSAIEALFTLRVAEDSGHPFDIAILDHIMPNMDGETLGRMIKTDPKALACFVVDVLTSSFKKMDGARFEAAGFSAYLVKPARAAVLLQTLVTLWNALALGKPLSGILTRHSLAEPGIQGQPPTAAKPERPQFPSIKVLVADDNHVNQKLASAAFGKTGLSGPSGGERT